MHWRNTRNSSFKQEAANLRRERYLAPLCHLHLNVILLKLGLAAPYKFCHVFFIALQRANIGKGS